jgi:predicted house-cleaning noncanonical NTP pyrophosphatase (MazG superfamily)
MAENPDIISVELSDGAVVDVEHLDWAGYKKLRPKLSAKLAESMSEFDGDGEMTPMAMMKPIVGLLDQILGDFTEDFVSSCVRDKKSLKNVTRPIDWLRLREAAAKVNNITEILDMEGNAIAASVRIVMTRFNALAAEDGGQESNTP